MPLDVFHLQIRTARVWRQKALRVTLLVLVLFVKDEHLEQVLTVDQFVLELLSFKELGL